MQSLFERGFFVLTCLLAALLVPAALQGQIGSITGTVTDPGTGEPISSVQIAIEGTGVGGLSAADGSYTLSNAPVGTHVVSAERIGYAQVRIPEVTVTDGEVTNLPIQMSPAALALEGIVATGLVDPVEGVRSPISVGRISDEQLQVPVAGSALANVGGRVAGVSMTRSGGQPGDEVQVQLRTVTSALSGTDPLFVVDGVILGGNTVNIESQDIESIEVIKGASAASLYGSRAAAGVISITTNRGQGLALGETRFTARTEMGIQQANRGNQLEVPRVHPFLMNDAQTQYVDQDGNPVDRENRVRPLYAFMDNPYPGPTYDNFDVVFQPGTFQTQNFSLSQNREDTNFAITFNRYSEQGALENNDGYERNSFRVNLDHRFLEDMSIGISAYHSRDNRDDLQLSFTDVIRAPVDVDLAQKDESGEFIRIPDPNVAYENPLWEEASRHNDRNSMRTLASGQFRWGPLNWMSIQANVSYDSDTRNLSEYTPKGTPVSITSDTQSDGELVREITRRDTGNGEVQVSLTRDFNVRDAVLNARTTFRGLAEVDRLDIEETEATDFFVTGVPQLSAASRFESSSSEETINALGFLWDTAFDYDGKYIFTGLLRYDGSSLFGSENRWHPYYRVAGAWRMGQEDWFDVSFLDEFKLSYARGTAGGRPSFEAQYETWNVSAGGVAKGTLGNVDLAPELTTEQEVSIEAIVGGRLGVDLVYAWQTTEDQILLIDVPSYTGFSQQWANGGEIKGNTWELTLEGQMVETAGFGWNSTFVFDYSRGTVGDWPGSCVNPSFRFICDGVDLYGLYGGGRLQNFTGPLSLETHHGGALLGHENKFDINDDGYLVYVGEGGSWTDGRWGESEVIEGVRYEFGMTFDELDETGNRSRPQLGNADHMNFGWINNFNLGNQFSIQTHATASMGGEAFSLEDRSLIQSGQSPQMDQSGVPEERRKPMEYYESLVPFGTPQLQSTDFIKLRLIGVNYQLSSSQIDRWGMGNLGIRSMSFGVLGRDLFTFTDFEAQDPEFALNVATGQVFSTANTYPPTRTFTAEVQVGF